MLTVDGLQRLGLTDPTIADMKPVRDGQVMIVGTAVGDTLFEAWGRDGVHRRAKVVVRGNTGDRICSLCILVPDQGPVHLPMVGDRIVIRGPITTVEQAQACWEAMRIMPSLHLLDAPSEAQLDAQVASVNAHLLASGVDALHTVRSGGQIRFEGRAVDAADGAIAAGWAQALFMPFARLVTAAHVPGSAAQGAVDAGP